jgi:hypothetical protein
MAIKFRNLRADEVEVRVNQIGMYSTQLLLYKDARCDMNILDETVGAENWQRGHSRDNANCMVSIWDEAKQQWVTKEDTGTESYTEKEKGLASDSFKRACVNWGIGRELYTAGRISVKNDLLDIAEKNGKKFVKDSFYVDSMTVENGVIKSLRINTDKGITVFEKKSPGQKIVCSVCHTPIPAETLINGKRYSAEIVADMSKKKYGVEMCYSCKRKADNDDAPRSAIFESSEAMQEIA